jgi:hypothetical protein
MFDFISNIFTPATKLIDDLHTSDEEKAKLRNELVKIQSQMHSKSIELMKAEVQSDHWIVAAWRPMVALLLFSLILADGYGIAAAPAQVYDLAEIFLATYAGGRSIEKVVRSIKK